MTISAAFNSAVSGLAAAGRASAVVSENIANAMTPGYGRRTLERASNGAVAPGVRIVGVTRHADPAAIADRRAADAGHAAARTLAGYHGRLAGLIGEPGDPAAIAARLADFETALIEAASLPDSEPRLTTAALRAGELAGALSGAAEGLRQMRNQADGAIGAEVERLNLALADVRKLNMRIASANAAGGETAGLIDQRQLLVDEIGAIAPVNVIARDRGQIALYSDGGAILLDGQAAQIGFTPAGETMAHMTRDNGLLSGLTINGVAVRTDSAGPALPGGTLAAQFRIRDELAVAAQADLDAVARDLVERFADPALDPTLASGAAGLFTDAGAALDPGAETGLAGRIRVNAAVDPAQGGAVWRLRDGLGATAPGEVGDARLLQALGQALAKSRTPPGSGRFGTGLVTAPGLAAALQSRAAGEAANSDRALSFAATSQAELARIEAEQGVDTDAELQNLLLIERAYAANARVIEAADQMLQTLMRL